MASYMSATHSGDITVNSIKDESPNGWVAALYVDNSASAVLYVSEADARKMIPALQQAIMQAEDRRNGVVNF